MICLYDSAEAPFASAAISAAGRIGRVKISTFNGTPSVLKEVKKGDIVTMDVGENLEWIGYAIVDQSMRIMGGLKPVKNARVPVRVFDSANIGQAGAAFTSGWGTSYVERLPEALGPEVAVPDAAQHPRLSLRSLSKSFGGTRALHGVDLDVLPGEIHGLLGENGSGKSTLIKILAGYHEPDAGELLVDGEEVGSRSRPDSSASSA